MMIIYHLMITKSNMCILMDMQKSYADAIGKIRYVVDHQSEYGGPKKAMKRISEILEDLDRENQEAKTCQQ